MRCLNSFDKLTLLGSWNTTHYSMDCNISILVQLNRIFLLPLRLRLAEEYFWAHWPKSWWQQSYSWGGRQPFEDNIHVHPKAHIRKHTGVQILEIQNRNAYIYTGYLPERSASISAELKWNKTKMKIPRGSREPKQICMKYWLRCKVIYFPPSVRKEKVWRISFSLAINIQSASIEM